MKKGKDLPKSNLHKLRDMVGLTQSQLANELYCDIKTYRDYEKGKQKPRTDILIEMVNYFKGRGISVSADYILGLSDFLTPENDYIGTVTGLNDTAINTLKTIKQHDNNSVFQKFPGLRVLPVLNSVFGAGSLEMISLLAALRNYINPDYIVPVYHTGKGFPKKSNSQLDYIQGDNQTIYIQHFARENAPDPNDNISVSITKDFMSAVALKGIEQALSRLKDSILHGRE